MPAREEPEAVQYAVEAVIVLAVLAAVAGVAAGMGDVLAPTWRDARPLPLPDGRPLDAADLAQLRFSIAFRGYRMGEVDPVLDRLAAEIAERDAEIAALRAQRTAPDESAVESEIEPADSSVEQA